MLIKKLKVKNFRNLRSVDLTFTSGINLVKAPNEGGKSSLRQTINLALYADPKSTSSKIQSMQTWGNDVMYEVSMQIASDKEEYLLTKDFEAKTMVLEEIGSGKNYPPSKKLQRLYQKFQDFPQRCFLKIQSFFQQRSFSK
ncbi:hypothetical protein N752_25870 [Desulforamulus aquiferis]|nr:AAA family ATPase [Desulforamulus aquiferis]RYD02243.1 hypothetical protein N752_25870 [Desulforamulus aquiferis]